MNNSNPKLIEAEEWVKVWDDTNVEFDVLCLKIQSNAFEAATEMVNKHRQTLFEDGLDADLEDMDKKAIFLESMTQERDSIEDMLKAQAAKLKENR